MRQCEVGHGHACHIGAVEVFLSKGLECGRGHLVALVVGLAVAQSDELAGHYVACGEVHVGCEGLLPCFEGVGLAAILILDFSEVKQQFGISGEDVGGVVAVEPASFAVLGIVHSLAAAMEAGSCGNGAACAGEAAAHIVEIAQHLAVVDGGHRVAVFSGELHKAARVEVADGRCGVAGVLLLGQQVGIVVEVVHAVHVANLVALVVVLRDCACEQLHGIVVLEVAVAEVAAVGAPEVVVGSLRSVGAAALDGHGGIVGIACKRLADGVDKLVVVFLLKVVLARERSQIAGNHCVGKLDPFLFVALVDVVVVGDAVAIVGLVVLLKILDGLLGPCAHLGIDFLLIVVVVRGESGHKGFLHRHLAVLLGEQIPRECLHGQTHAGQRPVFGLHTLVDHVLKVHTLAPVHHAPHHAAGIRAFGVEV